MKKSITIRLKISEIIYDIQNKTYLTGRSAVNGNNHAHVANMQANSDEENEAQILRSVTTAEGILRNRLAEYLDNAVESASNTAANNSDDIVFNLFLPGNFNSSVTQTLGDATHQFITSTAIAEWFAITARGETTDYSLSASEALKTLEEALSKRLRPSRLSV